MFFSLNSTASQLDINCGSTFSGHSYRLREFTLPKEKPSIGLMNGDGFFQSDKNHLWTKVYRENIETCSTLDEGFAIGSSKSVADMTNIESKPAYEEFRGEFLRKIFECFCKINPNLLNNCIMPVSYAGFDCVDNPSCGNHRGYKGNLVCVNGIVEEEVSSEPPRP